MTGTGNGSTAMETQAIKGLTKLTSLDGAWESMNIQLASLATEDDWDIRPNARIRRMWMPGTPLTRR